MIYIRRHIKLIVCQDVTCINSSVDITLVHFGWVPHFFFILLRYLYIVMYQVMYQSCCLFWVFFDVRGGVHFRRLFIRPANKRSHRKISRWNRSSKFEGQFVILSTKQICTNTGVFACCYKSAWQLRCMWWNGAIHQMSIVICWGLK